MKKAILIYWIIPVSLCLWGCQSPAGDSSAATQDQNPPAPGFNAQGSDPEAIKIADEVMAAMGGRQAWDQTHFLSWNFFGARQLLWDKFSGNVRVDIPGDSSVFLININDDTGRVLLKGEEVSDPDSLTKYLDRGKSIWINDSYWLVMPFKLKDSGVTLKYLGTDTTQIGRQADVLQLTFENVGKTPQNKYHVFVDQETHLVVQWQFFRNASDVEPAFTTPWEDYRPYGGILLSSSRGERQLSDIKVLTETPSEAFTSFDPVNYQ